MADGDVRSVLDKCVLKLNENTLHSEKFLSLQDVVAADFTSLTKTLYDLHKSHEPVDYNGSPLAQLVVDNFDEEQIWQELELQNTAVLRHFENVVSETISDDTLTLLDNEDEEYVDGEEEQREDDDDQEEVVDDEAEEGEEEPLSMSNKKYEDRAGEATDEESDTNFDIDALKEREKRKNHSVKNGSKFKGSPLEEDTGECTDEDSDINFDIDALEEREKRNDHSVRKGSKSKGPPSKVDDRFFKMSEMESFLDEMDKQEEKGDGENDDIDYFQDILSDEDDDFDLEEILSVKNKKKQSNLKSSRNLKYKDFFDAVDTDPAEVASHSDDEHDSMEEMQEDEEAESEEEEEEDDEEDDEKSILKDQDPVKSKKAKKRVTFDFSGDEDDEGEDVQDIFGGKKPSSAKSENQSSFEKRQEKMSKKIQELENSALAEKPWQLSGEVSAKARPENSILEEDVDFEQSSRMAPAITEETTLQLEDIIKQRIKDQVFDDVVRKVKPKEEVFEYKKRLTLDQEKSKLSLAEVYEQEYLKQNQQKTEEENPAHVEIQKLMDTLFLKLNALSNFSFTPKPPVPEVKVVSNMPSIAMEEVAPVSASDATLLAPEEIKEKNKAGDVLGDTEKTSTDKKRERRKKKKMKRLKIQEKERRLKLKEANKAGENKKASKAEMAENLRKVTKAGKATVLKDQGRDKALRSSQAFFSQLQDQVKSQIKTVKDQSSKKKKHKELSVSKLKL